MPDSGKTFLSKELSKKLNLQCYDSDELNPFLQIHKNTKPQWNTFRQQEYKIIKNLLQNPEPKIISTGGGCIESALLFNTLLNKSKQDLIIHVIKSKDIKYRKSNKNLPSSHEKLWLKRGKWYFLLSDYDYWNDETGAEHFLSWFETNVKN
jgi:shikimate kinase